MSSGSWTNSDGLYIQFGTAKAVAETAGDYLSYGASRVIEATINLASLTTGATTIISNTLQFPAGTGIIVDKVELETEVALGPITSGAPTTATLTVGLIQNDRTTAGTTYGASAFLAAVTSTVMSTAGNLTTYTAGTASAGNYIGVYNTQWNTNSITSGLTNSVGGYLTAILGTTTATGQVKVRIFYHGVGTIAF
jgi:hypothetical protein